MIRAMDIEISQPFETVVATFGGEEPFAVEGVKALIRLHGQPLGYLELPSTTTQAELEEQISREFGQQITEHLRRDKVPLDLLDCSPVEMLAFATGLPGWQPACQVEEARLLAHAPLITVVICTHNRAKEAVNSAKILLNQNYPNYELLIVDNASSDNEVERLVTREFAQVPQVRFVIEERKGLSWARNRGIFAARGEIIAFTDDDVIADPGWLSALWKNFSEGTHIACVTGMVVASELDTETQLLCEQYANFNKGFERRAFDNHIAEIGYPYLAGQFGTGGNMAFRRSFLLKIGGFDGRLGTGMPSCGGEDLDIFFRTIKGGGTIIYEPAAIIRHAHWREYPVMLGRMENYGKGLTAFLAKSVFANPLRLFQLLWLMPYGFYYLTSKKSRKNKNRSLNFPKELSRAEWRGMLYGPWTFVQSCLRARAFTRQFGKQPLYPVAAESFPVYPQDEVLTR
ncbi:MAG TPA: glycosyltransferase family 2 protein [Chloroflexia bacterium]|nr:glycosyltransferase family 2 protein [Chloroflexia bacterium]